MTEHDRTAVWADDTLPWRAAAREAGEALAPEVRDRAAQALADDPRAQQGIQAVGHASLDETARELATAEGRIQALQDLGVHVAGKLGERFGIADDEANRLLEESRRLATREGRQQVLRDQLGDAGAHLTERLASRGASVEERREQAAAWVAESAKQVAPAAGKGCLAVIVVAIIVLVAVLFGAAALLDGIVTGFGSGAAPAEALGVVGEWAGATRPT